MNSSTWSQGVPVANKAIQRLSGPSAREWDADEAELEHWHQSNLGNIGYLAILACIALLTIVAFVPVWLLLQGQRITSFLRGLVREAAPRAAAARPRR